MAILGFRGKARVSSFKSQMPDEENLKMAIAASTIYLFENIEKLISGAAAYERAPELECQLLSAGVLYMGKQHAPKRTCNEQTHQEVGRRSEGTKAPTDDKINIIQNVNLYVTAQTVQQLNISPKEVKNTIQELLNLKDQ